MHLNKVMPSARYAMQILTMSPYGEPQRGYVVVSAQDSTQHSKYGCCVMRVDDMEAGNDVTVIDVFCPIRQGLCPMLQDMGEVDEEWPDCAEGMAVKGDCCVWAMGLCRHTHQGIENKVEEMNKSLGLRTVWLDKTMLARMY